jgi:hypothetical protein
MSPIGTFLPFAALHHHGSCWRYSGHVADIAEPTRLTHNGPRPEGQAHRSGLFLQSQHRSASSASIQNQLTLPPAG